MGAPELMEARREIRDPHRIAVAVGQHRRDDGRIAQILGMDVDHVLEHDVGEALFLGPRQQAGEQRVTVEAREAPPDDARRRIDQRGRAPVADHRQIEPEILRGCLHGETFSTAGAIRSSQPRTLCGVSK